jgi:hypothetical protein
MARDPLKVLWRVRDAAVTEASRDLAAARTCEMRASRRLDEHRLEMRDEQLVADDGHVAAFAAWLPSARLHADRLTSVLLTEQAHVLRLQQVLVARRTEAEAVTKVMQRRLSEASVMLARKEQATMDEAAGRTGRHHGVGE